MSNSSSLRKKLLDVLSFEKAVTPRRLWLALSLEERSRALGLLLRPSSNTDPAVGARILIAARKYGKPRLARSVPPTAPKVARVAANCDPTHLPVQEALRELHVHDRRQLLEAFVTALDLPHERGLVEANEPKLGGLTATDIDRAVAGLVGVFAADDIAIYLLTLLCNEPGLWGAVEEWRKDGGVRVLSHAPHASPFSLTRESTDLEDETADAEEDPEESEPIAGDLTNDSVQAMATDTLASIDEEDAGKAILEAVASTKERFTAIAEELSAASISLRRGLAPDWTIAERLLSARDAFRTVQADVRAYVAPSDRPTVDSMEEMRAAVECERAMRLAQARGSVVSAATAILNAAARIVGPPSIANDLSAIVASARRVLEKKQGANAVDAEIQQLANGSHPIAALVALARDAASLSLEQIAELDAKVREAFGSGIALAATARMLTFLEPLETQPSEEDSSTTLHAGPTPDVTLPEVAAETATGAEQLRDDVEKSPASTESTVEISATAGPSVSETAESVGWNDRQDQPWEVVEELAVQTRTDGMAHSVSTAAVGEIRPRVTGLTLPPTDRGSAADLILHESPLTSLELTGRLVASLLIEEGPGIALAVAEWARGEARDTESVVIAPWILRALAMSPHIVASSGEMASELQEAFANFDESVFREGDRDWNEMVRLLLVAATLRPALLAPASNASNVLRALHLGHLEALRDYCDDLCDSVNPGVSFDEESLARVVLRKNRQSAIQSVKQDAEDWLNHARAASTLFRAASDVWRALNADTGELSRLIIPIVRGQASAASDVRRLADQLQSREQVRAIVKEVDRRRLGRKRGAEISSSALKQLENRVAGAVTIARRWLTLIELGDIDGESSRESYAEKLGSRLSTRTMPVLNELRAYRQTYPHLAGFVSLCIDAVRSVASVFDEPSALQRREPAVGEVLHGPLLIVPRVRVDMDWALLGDFPSAGLSALRSIAHEGFQSWNDAISSRTTEYDFVGAQAAADFALRASRITAEEYEQKRSLIRRSLDLAVQDLRWGADSARAQVEQAFSFGMLGEADRKRLVDSLDSVRQQADSEQSLDLARVRLREVNQNLADARTRATAEANVRLREASIDSSHPDYPLIAAAVQSGDLLTTGEYVEVVRSGQRLSSTSTRHNDFDQFFPECVSSLSAAGAETSAGRIVSRIGNRGSVGSLSYASLSEDEIKLAKEAAEAWFNLRTQRGRLERATLTTLLRFVGFNVVRMAIGKPEGTRNWVELNTSVIADRSVCPSPHFGSQANGNYRLLVLWDPNPDHITGALRTSKASGATIVVYMGRLSDSQRRSLARECRVNKFRAVVLDESLMLFLLQRGSGRLGAFFRCALPFAHTEPNESRPGYVPPELFYGRRREYDAITAPNDSCFVFGGRQLGKTALLRKVEADFNTADGEHRAVYIDLKSHGIGEDRALDAFWNVIAVELKQAGVLPSEFPAGTQQPEKVIAAIHNWLEESAAMGRRRLLLLLDEADAFFELDGRENGFAQTARIKGLMERSNRRFKTVFAGLHNVQRATTLSNHPLAHLGTPICIGPLFEQQEWKEAFALVEQPLRSAGFIFESPMLIWRILAQVNYYPSLLQLYCQRLFEHVSQAAVWDERRTPPYVITESHVREAYENTKLQSQIRERFWWTLDLDVRYRVIALCVAYAAFWPEGDNSHPGLTLDEIRRRADYWWEGGFAGVSRDRFRTLVEEMEGLGILRQIGPDRYGFRGTNVQLLMGTAAEVEGHIANLPTADDLNTRFDLTNLRRRLRSADSRYLPRRSPFTARQESMLRQRRNEISFVCGTSAAAIADVALFLRDGAAGEEYLRVADESVVDRPTFQQWLQEAATDSSEGITTCVVPSHLPWSEKWAADASRQLMSSRKRIRGLHVTFLADPATTWRLIREIRPFEEGVARLNASLLPIGTWHTSVVHTWLDELGVRVSDPAQLELLRHVTGLWPASLYQVVDRLGKNTSSAHFKAVLEGIAAEEARRLPDLVQGFGLDVADPARVIRQLGVLGEPTTPEDLAEWLDHTVTPDSIDDALKWGELLSLATRTGPNVWKADPVVARLSTMA